MLWIFWTETERKMVCLVYYWQTGSESSVVQHLWLSSHNDISVIFTLIQLQQVTLSAQTMLIWYMCYL